MGDDADYAIETTDAGASATIPMEAGQIKKGGYVYLESHCLVGIVWVGAATCAAVPELNVSSLFRFAHTCPPMDGFFGSLEGIMNAVSLTSTFLFASADT